jgi:hypothetical protein
MGFTLGVAWVERKPEAEENIPRILDVVHVPIMCHGAPGNGWQQFGKYRSRL